MKALYFIVRLILNWQFWTIFQLYVDEFGDALCKKKRFNKQESKKEPPRNAMWNLKPK